MNFMNLTVFLLSTFIYHSVIQTTGINLLDRHSQRKVEYNSQDSRFYVTGIDRNLASHGRFLQLIPFGSVSFKFEKWNNYQLSKS